VVTDDLLSLLSILLEEHDVPPGRCPEVAGVVVRITGPGEPVVGNFIPFFTCDLARFAANANARVSKETNLDVVLHVRVSPLVCALKAFANHNAGEIEWNGVMDRGNALAFGLPQYSNAPLLHFFLIGRQSFRVDCDRQLRDLEIRWVAVAPDGDSAVRLGERSA
jgi:hypothetical protein